MKNYFEIFGLSAQFALDLAALDATYFALQQQSHPDKSTGNTTSSSEINVAYKTLKSRFLRAEHLLELRGQTLQAGQSLLIEMMELRDEPTLQTIAKTEEEIEKLFEEFTKTEAPEVFVRIKYLQRFIEENA